MVAQKWFDYSLSVCYVPGDVSIIGGLPYLSILRFCQPKYFTIALQIVNHKQIVPPNWFYLAKWNCAFVPAGMIFEQEFAMRLKQQCERRKSNNSSSELMISLASREHTTRNWMPICDMRNCTALALLIKFIDANVKSLKLSHYDYRHLAICCRRRSPN